MWGRLRAATRAATIHLTCGLGVAALVAVIIFGVWYPYPYFHISTGKYLFLILFFVDLVCGPLMTLLLFDTRKERWKWHVDLGLILTLQIGALIYGMCNIIQSRPVYLAYEGDRFRVVYAANIDKSRLNETKGSFSVLGWGGPRLVGTRLLESTDAGYLESIKRAIEGEPPSFRPDRWVDYSSQKEQLIASLKPMERLQIDPKSGYSLSALAEETGLSLSDLGYLPLVQDSEIDWVVIVGRKDGLPKAYWRLNGW